jgi:ATP-dependent exoDNAse (exonuclease V) alpha subunit
VQEQTLAVLTDEEEHIDYDFAELDELAHAYAITIHRSEASKYPAVVLPLTTSAWLMLQRNQLYTGIAGRRVRCTRPCCCGIRVMFRTCPLEACRGDVVPPLY